MLIREKIEKAIKKNHLHGTEVSCGEIIDCVCKKYEDTNRTLRLLQ